MIILYTIFDILVYVFFAWAMSSFAKKSNNLWPNSPKIDKYLWRFILFYTFISAIRWRVGQDCSGYVYSFIAQKPEFTREWIYDSLVFVVQKLGLHFTIGMAVLAFLQVFFLTKALAPYKYLLVFIPIVLFGSRYYMYEMNAMRQMIVASAFVFYCKYIVDRKPWSYFSAVLLSMLMHHSALILIPFYFVPEKWTHIANKRNLMLIIFAVCFILGINPRFSLLVEHGFEIANFIGYEGNAEFIAEVATGAYTEEKQAFGPMMLSYMLIAIINILYGPKLKREYENKIPYFNIWYFFSFLWGCLFFLVHNVANLYIRPTMFFTLFEMIILSLVLYDLNLRPSRNQLKIIIIMMIIWVNIAWEVFKAERYPSYENTIYKVFFMHQDELNNVVSRYEERLNQ